MSTFHVKNYEPSDAESWNNALNRSKSNLFLFHRSFMDYHSNRFQDSSLLLYSGEKLRGLFPANRDESVVYSHQGLTYGGLLTSSDVKTIEVGSMLDTVADHFRSLGVKTIHYKKIPWCFSTNPSAEDEYFLYQRGATLVRRDLSSVIDLRMRPRLSDSRKNLLKKANNQDMTVMQFNDFSLFHELLSRALARHNAKPVHSIAELELLASRFPQNIRLYGSFRNEKLLATACLFDFGHIAHTQYLAVSDEGRKIGSLDYLLESLIQECTLSGKHFFSFGISTEEAGKVLNHGLVAQKEGFGGRGVLHDFYEWNLT